MKLYLPKKIKVGYQERKDTYTGKLAYVIYYDDKGVLRKEASWKTWCDLPESPSYRYNPDTRDRFLGPGIPSDEYDNVPTSGFVLNKKVGGYKSDWNFRNAYCRVYDPRGFEFEISVDNLLFILECSNSYKGKGLEGEFIYSWDKTTLVLLPVDSATYKESLNHTKLVESKFSARDLKVGNIYTAKSGEKLTYIGRFNYTSIERSWRYSYRADNSMLDYKTSKQHVFAQCGNNNTFKYFSNLPKAIANDTGVEDKKLPFLVDEFLASINGTEIEKIELEEIPNDIKIDDRNCDIIVPTGSGFIIYNYGSSYNHQKRKYEDNLRLHSDSHYYIKGNNLEYITNNNYGYYQTSTTWKSISELMQMKQYKIQMVGKNGKKYEYSL